MAQNRVPRGVPTGGQFAGTKRGQSTVTLHEHEHGNGQEQGPPGLHPAPAHGWPQVTVATRPWRTNPDLRGPNGARPNQADRALREIEVEIPALIADCTPPLSPETVTACEDAAGEVSSLESRATHLSGLGDLLVRTEAVASSKIEHIYADLDDIARASLGEDAGERARSTVAASLALRALTESCDDGRPLTEDALLTAHHELLHEDLLEHQWAGRYRAQQNWIGGSDLSPRTAVHIPPPPEHVTPLMDDLVAFANRDDLSAIAQAAVAHAQFESIHPFTDGNGRVGRALIGAVLRRRGVTRKVTVPVAAAMLADVDAYFDRLKDYQKGDGDALVGYVARSAVTAAEAAKVSADRLGALPNQWRDRVRPRKKSSTDVLLDRLLETPILDFGRARAMLSTAPNRIYDALDRLTEHNVLVEITGHGRNRIWVASDVLTELSNLEERIGVRSRPSQRWT